MIDPLTIGRHEIGYSWVDEYGKYWAWMTDRMAKHARETHMKIEHTAVEPDIAKWVLQANGVERHRLERLTPQVLLSIPVIYAVLPTDKTPEGIHHKLVDGSHRYVKAALLGWRELPGYVFDLEQAREFQLDIPPEFNELAKSTIPTFSGIV